MNKTIIRGNEVKKMVIGTVMAIGLCTVMFICLTQISKAAVYKNTEAVPTNYNIDSITGLVNSNVPAGYEKSNYKVELVDLPDKPTEKDMSKEEAAELGAQNLWRLFGENLSNQTIYMTYIKANEFQSRALWYGEVYINDVLYYSFQLDTVTGEYYMTSRWDNSKDSDSPGKESQELIKNYQEYISLAKETAEKYQLVPGKVISSEYVSQRSSGQTLVIDIQVKSDNGQEAQLTFSTHSKELTFVSYNNCLKQEESNMEKSNQEAEQAENGIIEEAAANAN